MSASARSSDYNWLYGQVRNIEDHEACLDSGWDNDATTAISRALLTAVQLLAALVIAGLGYRQRRSVPRDPPVVAVSKSERLPHLDFARIIGVACVVAENTGGRMHSHYNAFFVLQWVLPFIHITSGMAFVLSGKPFWRYVLRLAVILAVGLGANLFADFFTGRALGWSTVAQMSYAALLIACAALGLPLRSLLRGTCAARSAAVLMYCVLGFAGLGLVLTAQPRLMGTRTWVFAEVLGVAALVALACAVGATRALGWVLLAVIYAPRILSPRVTLGYGHGIQLYVLGMVVARLPLAGEARLRAVVGTYWPLLFTLLLLSNLPTSHGRCDLYPARTVWERLRFYAIEICLVVAFVSGTFVVKDDLGLTKWLGNWALYAYCFHVAWSRVLHVPYGAVATYGSIPVFFALHHLKSRHSCRPSAAPDEFDTWPLPGSIFPVVACPGEGHAAGARVTQAWN